MARNNVISWIFIKLFFQFRYNRFDNLNFIHSEPRDLQKVLLFMYLTCLIIFCYLL